jgi:autotransporter-associated beta strand protein
MTLAATNSITATNRIVVGAAQQPGSTAAKLRLGATSVLNASAFVIGSSRASGTIEFAAANGTVTIRGATGGSTRTDVFMGDQTNTKGSSQNAGGSSSSTGTMNFTGGSVDARIENLMLGLGAGSGTTHPQGNGNFTMDGASSVVDINTLVVAQDVDNASTNTGTASIGTFTVANGTLQVNTAATLANDIDTSATPNGTQNLSATFTVAGGTATIGSSGSPVNLILGNHVNAGNPGTNTVAVSLTGGTLNVFGDLKEGNLGAGTITSSLVLDGGTLDMKGSNVTSLDTISYTNGTLKNLGVVSTGLTLAGTGARVFEQGASISGAIQGAVDGAGVGLTKTGPGTLTLNGANTYTGNTTVSNGTLVIAVASLATNSTVTVASGAVLQLNFATTNVVTALYLNGVQQAAGIYSSANSGGLITGSGSLQALTGGAVAPSATLLTNSLSGANLSLSWPAGQGWRLQQQTNAASVGLRTNWVDVTDSSVSSTNIVVDKTRPTVFYRLVYP